MIFFGTRGTQIGSTTCSAAVCNHCQNNTFVIHTYSRYFHVFWIPIFPYQKKHFAECTHCKKTIAQNGFTASMNEAVAQNPAKTPLWQFAGLLFFGGIMALSLIQALIVIIKNR